MAECSICRTIAAIGAHPDLIAELDETFAILGEHQGSRGWCVLLLKEHAEHLADLPPERQQRIFADVMRMAAAIRAVFPTSGADGGPPRINYGCLCNQVPHIHWHLVPRHAGEANPKAAPWCWPAEQLQGSMCEGERRELAGNLSEALSSI